MVDGRPGLQSAQLTLSGSKAVVSSNRLLTTVAYQLDGKRTYPLEAVCYQTNDLLQAMKSDWGARGKPSCGLMAA
jgi:glycerol kinase